jgi:hypothetical protein
MLLPDAVSEKTLARFSPFNACSWRGEVLLHDVNPGVPDGAFWGLNFETHFMSIVIP